MNSPSPDQLAQAKALLRDNQAEAARAALAAFVRQNPNSEEAWLLLSQAMEAPRQQADCLRQALRINPANQAARQRLEQLEGIKPAPAPETTPPAPPPQPEQSSRSQTIYVAKPPPEPGFDFWIEDDAAEPTVAPAAKPAQSQPPKAAVRPPAPAAQTPKAAPAAPVAPAAAPAGVGQKPSKASAEQIPNPLTGAVEPAKAGAGSPGDLLSFAPDAAEPASPAAHVEAEKKPVTEHKPAAERKPKAKKKPAATKTKQQSNPAAVIVILVVALLLVTAIGGGIWIVMNLPGGNPLTLLTGSTAPAIAQQAPGETPIPTQEPPLGMPPPWTPRPTSTAIPPPTITPPPAP